MASGPAYSLYGCGGDPLFSLAAHCPLLSGTREPTLTSPMGPILAHETQAKVICVPSRLR